MFCLQILLQFSKEGPFAIEGCPDPVEPAAINKPEEGLESFHLKSPPCPDKHEITELLQWFANACASTGESHCPNGDPK